MSKLLGLKDFLTEDEAVDFFNYLTSQQITKERFNELLADKYLTPYRNDIDFVVPVELANESFWISKIDFDNKLAVNQRYKPIAGANILRYEASGLFINCVLTDDQENSYIYQVGENNDLDSVVLTWFTNDNHDIQYYFKKDDISELCKQFNEDCTAIKYKPVENFEFSVWNYDVTCKRLYLFNHNVLDFNVSEIEERVSNNIADVEILGTREKNTLYTVIAMLLLDNSLFKEARISEKSEINGHSTIAYKLLKKMENKIEVMPSQRTIADILKSVMTGLNQDLFEKDNK